MKRKHFSLLGVAALLVVLALWVPGAERQEKDSLNRITLPFHFNLSGWELKHFPDRWLYQITHGFRRPNATSKTSIDKVERYFRLASQIGGLERKLEMVRSGLGQGEDEARIRQQLGDLRAEQRSLKGDVEFIVERMIAEVIAEEKLHKTFLGLKYLWPPVDFTFDRLPRVLVISPRHKIELLRTRLLETGIALEERERIESQIAQQNLSALVEDLGGVSTYPAIVQNTEALRAALDIAAHEWMHHYLFFKPLGRSYQASRLSTINETVANIWGNEVGERVFCRFWGPCEKKETPQEPKQEETRDASRFDFAREMRRIRLAVDEMLAQGKINEAESFMEEQRKFLAEHGYFIRKLNQAYFAFHGSYADTPTSVDPIGEQLKTLRRRSTSLGDFIRVVQSVRSVEEYEAKVLPLLSTN